jgi:hypothetical protein
VVLRLLQQFGAAVERLLRCGGSVHRGSACAAVAPPHRDLLRVHWPARRATDRQILEDADHLIMVWNASARPSGGAFSQPLLQSSHTVPKADFWEDSQAMKCKKCLILLVIITLFEPSISCLPHCSALKR